MRVYQLVDWMDALSLGVTHFNVTLDELNDEEYVFSQQKLRATKDSLFAELRTFDDYEPWIIALDLDTAKVVALPWWYFREAEL